MVNILGSLALFQLRHLLSFFLMHSLFSLIVSFPLGLLCGSQLECPGLCKPSLHGDALRSGKQLQFLT